MHHEKHRAHQSTEEDLAIHCSQCSLVMMTGHTTGPRLLRPGEWDCHCAATSPL